jgi:hypothetical protein
MTPLAKNTYRNIIIPLVATLNDPKQRAVNPHVKLAIANLLIATTQRWGIHYMQSATPGLVDKLQPSGKDVVSYETNIISGALADRVPNPYNSLVEGLRRQLDAKPTSNVNAWVDWVYALDYFFDNVPYVDYFLYEYKAGSFKDFYLSATSTAFHKSGFATGLLFSQVADGQGSTPAVPTTIVVVTEVVEEDAGQYMIIYPDAKNGIVFTLKVDEIGTHPVLPPVEGITYYYHYVELRSIDSDADNALEFRNIVNINGQGMKAAMLSDVTVEITAASSSLVPPTKENDIWATTFENGNEGIGGLETYTLDFTYVSITELVNRFFIVYTSDGEGIAFYYKLNGNGTQPRLCSECVQCNPCVGDFVTSFISVDLLSFFTKNDIMNATKEAILTTGLFDVNVDRTGKSIMTINYIDQGSISELDPGTAILGINYAYNSKLYSSNGILLAEEITTDEAYALAWNTLRVPYEATQGNVYPYLNPIVSGTGRVKNCGIAPCGTNKHPVEVIGLGDDSFRSTRYICMSCSDNTGKGMFRLTAFNSYRANLPCSKVKEPGVPCIPDFTARYLATPCNNADPNRPCDPDANAYNYPGIIFDVLNSNRNKQVVDFNGQLT